MTLQWIIVAVVVAVCMAWAIYRLSRKHKNPCDSCAVKDCCKNPRKK